MKIIKSSLIVGLGLIAGALCAFTTKVEVKKTPNSLQTAYFWYPVNTSGVTTGSTLNPLAAEDKASAKMDLTTCTDVPTKPFCILGSTNSAEPSGANLSGAPADAKILRTN